MRDGDPGGGRDGGDRRDARDDVVVDPRIAEHLELLAPAAEDERVAALEAHDVEVAPELDEEAVDLLLRQPVAADAERVGGRLVDELLRDEPVVDDGVAGAQPLQPADGDQPRVARPGADERDAHRSSASTSCWK